MFVSESVNFYFISTGSQTKMFTLRAMVQGYNVGRDGLRTPAFQTEYMTNLSTDWSTAVQKAQNWSEANGIPFQDINGETDLDAITRLKAGEREAIRQAQIEAKEERDLKAAMKRSDDIVEFFSVNPSKQETPQFGKYNGDLRTFAELAHIDPEYFTFLVENMGVPADGLWENVAQYQTQWIRQNVTIPSFGESQHVGAIKDKIAIDVMCVRKTGFANDYGWVDRYTCRDEDGNIFLIDYTGCKWDMEVGGEYHVSGGVKAHDEYRDVKQTKLTRAKVMTREEKEAADAVLAAKKVKTPKAPSSTAPKKGTKMDNARAIFAEYRLTESRGFIIQKFMDELEMGQAGAATYYQKCKKEVQ